MEDPRPFPTRPWNWNVGRLTLFIPLRSPSPCYLQCQTRLRDVISQVHFLSSLTGIIDDSLLGIGEKNKIEYGLKRRRENTRARKCCIILNYVDPLISQSNQKMYQYTFGHIYA